ncbi:MAG: 16S rRNA (cytidine(1402)-2'-O)-methyltransferase [Patescibacteria group bacterium]
MLYIVATPIGNLGDISSRAVETFRSVDFIACEDTRVTSKLLARFEISKPLISYHQHSLAKVTDGILEKLKEGKNIALVTDAGTPGISDPGGRLVEAIISMPPLIKGGEGDAYENSADNQIKITPIPGPCAAVTALSASGFPADKFVFLGFPPNKKGRNKWFEELAQIDKTIVFYESTYRILKALEAIGKILPDRQLVVCRELTKMYETIYRGTAHEVTQQLNASSIKGEFVVVIKNTKP